jgi:AraC-like DNA-binding protein
MQNIHYETIINQPTLLGTYDNIINIIKEKANSEVSLHWHHAIEIVYVTEGDILYTENGTAKSISAGEFYFINRDAIHGSRAKKRGEFINLLVLVLSDDLLNQISPDITKLIFNIDKSSDGYKKIKDELINLYNYYHYNDKYKFIAIGSCIQKILYYLLTYFVAGKQEQYIRLETTKKALEYIGNNYTRDISLDEISRVAGLQKNYFCRSFKNDTGMSFDLYLNRMRVNSVLSQMQYSGKKELDASIDSGFSSSKSFIEWCKKIYGKNPRQILKNKV